MSEELKKLTSKGGFKKERKGVLCIACTLEPKKVSVWVSHTIHDSTLHLHLPLYSQTMEESQIKGIVKKGPNNDKLTPNQEVALGSRSGFLSRDLQ